MTEAMLKTLVVNGLRMQVAIQGNGPLVVLCHGFPELWISWRAQLKALAEAGYRAVAPDMRGYGGTSAPDDPSAYTILHVVGDMVELVEQLGDERAAIVGHDWGALVAWHSAMLRPDIFHAVVGLSIPFTPQGSTDLLHDLERIGIKTSYLQYFQTPGVAEAELERDVKRSIREIYYLASGEAPGRAIFGLLGSKEGLLGDTAELYTPISSISPEDLSYIIEEFTRTGFRGGLNWYRNIRRSWELLRPWRAMGINQPSMFIAGSQDDVLKFPTSRSAISNFPNTLPGLREVKILEGAGHWVQRERASDVNLALLQFLDGLR